MVGNKHLGISETRRETNLPLPSLLGHSEVKQSKLYNSDYHSDKAQKYICVTFSFPESELPGFF